MSLPLGSTIYLQHVKRPVAHGPSWSLNGFRPLSLLRPSSESVLASQQQRLSLSAASSQAGVQLGSDHFVQLKRVGVRRRARVSHCARHQQPQLGHAQRRLLVRRATGGEFS
jgi:hypothetical protein